MTICISASLFWDIAYILQLSMRLPAVYVHTLCQTHDTLPLYMLMIHRH